MNEKALLAQLAQPFAPQDVTWKPGTAKGERCLALTYADLRAYMNRLDEICGFDWSASFEPWGDSRIICRLTIHGVTRSSTGEYDAQDEKNGIAGTVAEAQAFKRAAAMFGMGRSLYEQPTTWVDYDPQSRRITDAAHAKLLASYTAWYKRELAKAPQQAPQPPATGQRATTTPDAPHSPATQGTEADGTPPHQRLFGIGLSVLGPAWNNGGRKWLLRAWSKKVTPESVRESLSDFSDDEKTLLADYVTEHAKDLQRIWREYEAEKAAKAAA